MNNAAPPAPTGHQFDLAAGDYRAVVTEVGARLRTLTIADRPLVRPFAADALPPLYSGAVLAPWPNRIADGRYSFDGREFQLPINEVDRGNALHGLVHDRPWSVDTESADRVSLRHRIWPSEGYPFAVDLSIDYQLGPDGLTIHLTAVNVGESDAPYGCSIHPYLVAGAEDVDDWTLRMPAERVLDVDAERLLPQRIRLVDEEDFRDARQIGNMQIDHAFTGLGDPGDLELTAADGGGVRMWWTAATPWLQLHTADRPEPQWNRTGLAAEPMTCPPDAFNSGTDLLRLAPGADHHTTIRIAAIRPSTAAG